jgi:histidinol dehydrogenase
LKIKHLEKMEKAIMELIKHPDRKDWKAILTRPRFNAFTMENMVLNILEQVKALGDEAVRKYTHEFDKVYLEDFKVSKSEFDEAEKLLTPSVKKSIITAIHNIERFHRNQVVMEKPIETTPGVKCWQKSVPIQRVGLYIPGGTAPLFSTLLMLGIPAKIVGCKEIVVCSPPNADGKTHPAILFTAKVIGLDHLFKIGGVQAIAAMAYGTETVPAVYKIFGPGNQYVTTAKQMVSREGIAIDMPAGPSELAMVVDDSCIPSFVASDLLSQAEHGVDSQVMLVTTKEECIDPIIVELKKQLDVLPRKEIASASLKNSKIILLDSVENVIELINEYAPEHLIIAARQTEMISSNIFNAGSVFLGNFSPESAGDYASGTNHTLPTNGYARIYGGVNIDSFIKKITFQQISEYGLFNIGSAVMEMATIEDLEGHKNAVKLRLDSLKDKKD